MTDTLPDAGFAGREYPATSPYSVGREKLREFAAAVGAQHPAHFDLEAARGSGYPDLVAPATFAVVVAQAAEAQYVQDPAARIDFSRVVHADERFTHHRPIVAGDELTGVMTVTSVKQLGGNSMVTSSTEISDASGAHVVTAISTLVVRAEEAAA